MGWSFRVYCIVCIQLYNIVVIINIFTVGIVSIYLCMCTMQLPDLP